MRSSFHFRFISAALGFFAATATTCSSAAEYRLADPTFFVEGQIVNSYDPWMNEFDPPFAPPILDMEFTVGNDNPYILASATQNGIFLYSVFTGYENAYENYLPEGWDPQPRLINWIPNNSSFPPKFALSDGGFGSSYLASTDGDDGIVRIRRNDHGYYEDLHTVLAQPFTILEDTISVPGGVSAMAFKPNQKAFSVDPTLALGRPDGVVEVYKSWGYFPMDKGAEFYTGTDGLPVEQIGFSNAVGAIGRHPFRMVVVVTSPEGNSMLKLYYEEDELPRPTWGCSPIPYFAPRIEHVTEAKVQDFVFSNDNSSLAVLISDGNILVYDASNEFQNIIATISANATSLAFHANDEFLYAGTSKPAKIKTYSTTTWREIQHAADSVSLDFCDSIHKMIFRPVRSELGSIYQYEIKTALWNEEENVVHELALLTSKEDVSVPDHGSVPDLVVVFRVEPDPSAAPTVAPTVAETTAATETDAPTAASGAQSKREWKALAALASIWLLHSIAICL